MRQNLRETVLQSIIACPTLGIQTIQAKKIFHEIQSSYLQLEKRMYTRFSRQFQLFYILYKRFTGSMGLCTLMTK